MTGENIHTVTRRAFLGLAVMAAQAAMTGCVRNGAAGKGSTGTESDKDKSGDDDATSPFGQRKSDKADAVDGIEIGRVTLEDATGPDGKPFQYIRVTYTFENVTESDTVAPATDINAYQDGLKLDRSYKVKDSRAQKQIEPGGKLESFAAFVPDSETVPVTVKVMAPGEKKARSERCYCIVTPELQ